MSPTSPHAPAETLGPPRSGRDPFWWHLALLLGISGLYEYSFIHLGLNLLDEGWPLYAAKRLHEGGTLYRDVFFVFPPGHLLTAWLGYAWEPPGILPTRVLDACLNTSLVVALYALGRRLMPPAFAFLGALLLAVATPYSHVAHFLFGYRYLIWTVLALLAFCQRVETGRAHWMLVAGFFTGVSASFRQDPAVACMLALTLGVLAADRRPKVWLRDLSLAAAGGLLVVGPVFWWLASSVGVETLWREVVVRPLVMTDLQSLPIPELAEPRYWNRTTISRVWTAVQFRTWSLLWIGYVASAAWLWLRALRRREAFSQAIFLACVAWGAIFFARSFGRSDVAHLESALPPVCLFLGHLTWLSLRRVLARPRFDGFDRALLMTGAILSIFSVWIYLFGTDMHVKVLGRTHYFEEIEGISMKDGIAVRQLDKRIAAIRETTRPGDTILDLSFGPLFHVITDRNGPGWFDLVMPGTFMSPEEERFFVEQLESKPPALVVILDRHFDDDPDRSLRRIAPEVVKWVKPRYRVAEPVPDYNLMYPNDAVPVVEPEPSEVEAGGGSEE